MHLYSTFLIPTHFSFRVSDCFLLCGSLSLSTGNIIYTLRDLFACLLFFKPKKNTKKQKKTTGPCASLEPFTKLCVWINYWPHVIYRASGSWGGIFSCLFVMSTEGNVSFILLLKQWYIPFLVHGTHQSDCGLIFCHSCHLLKLVKAQGWS